MPELSSYRNQSIDFHRGFYTTETPVIDGLSSAIRKTHVSWRIKTNVKKLFKYQQNKSYILKG